MFSHNSPFCIEARACINQFKRIWRQNKTNFIQNGLDISTFDIKRKQIKNYNEVELHHAVSNLSKRISSILKTKHHKLYAHKGLSSFLETLHSLLSEFQVQGDQVVNQAAYASELLLSILQELPTNTGSDPTMISRNTVEKIKKIKKIDHQQSNQLWFEFTEKIKNISSDLYSNLIAI